MREPFLERLEKRPLISDGAMGTMLYSKGIPFSRCFDELNLSMPQLVKEVHLGYVKAGAEVVETNTFGATSSRLKKFELGEQVREINLAGVRLGGGVAGDDLYVAGSVGPLGIALEPLGPTSLEEAREIFRQQIAALVEGGVDLIVIETMVDLQEARQALLAARDVAPLPLVVQMTIQDDGSTPTAAFREDFTRQFDGWGADVIGLNCGAGPAGILETLERMARVTAKKLSAQPNAGLPRTVDGRSIYLCSPEYMASYARRFIEAGVRLLGGCCGTTPEHIKAIKAAVRSLQPQPARAAAEVRSRPVEVMQPVPLERRSRLAAKLAAGESPPLGGGFGPAAPAVLDVDSIGLVNVLNNLNRGLDVGGNPMGTQTGFLIGVEVNPYALDVEEELRRFQFKVEAGANFAVTQPVFDAGHLARFLERIERPGIARVPILAGIEPATSFL